MKRKSTGFLFEGAGARYVFEVETTLDYIALRARFEETYEGEVYDVREQGQNIYYVTYETRNQMIHNLADECNRNGGVTMHGYRVKLLYSEPF